MIEGKNYVGKQKSAEGSVTFQAYSPTTQELLPETFYQATHEELENAVEKAKNAFHSFKSTSNMKRASFLRDIAIEIEALGDVLIERASLETGLSKQRILGERERTATQLRLFADLVDEGSWMDAKIDVGNPAREPAPKPDIRKTLVPVGPVGIFTASNFPLAFSTAGGDTASALAAGNTVIIKCHPYHPGTNELVAGAIITAAKKNDIDDGVFSSLNALDYSVGEELVLHKDIKSIAFTGSLQGGMALYKLAQSREDPIPVFAEMGSVNPIFILPEYLKLNTDLCAATMAGSVTLGSGQFCTKPGIMVSIDSPDLEQFEMTLRHDLNDRSSQPMLHTNIEKNYKNKLSALASSDVLTFSEIEAESLEEGTPLLGVVGAEEYLSKPWYSDEIFGPFSLLIKCKNKAEFNDVLNSFQGQLTVTVLCEEEDLKIFSSEISEMSAICGRLIFNGVPTGVEVCSAMHHGGPFPATTDSRFTSVGTDAINRFVRPVAFQNSPEAFLPLQLRNNNSLKVLRQINGVYTRDSIQ